VPDPKEEAKKNKINEYTLPKYMDEDLPDASIMPVKLFITSMNDHFDRPPAHALEPAIKELYKADRI